MASLLKSDSLTWFSYIRYVIIRIVLWSARRYRKSKFFGLRDNCSNDPFRNGTIPSRSEFAEEWPYGQTDLSTRKIDDRLTIFCTSSIGQMLVVKFTRTGNRLASVFLYLRCETTSYVLSRQLSVDLSADDTFAIDGLKLECVIPMRRWRVSFNGLLRNLSTEKEDHVRFVFTANFTNGLADLCAFHSERLVALTLCQSPTFSLISALCDPKSIYEKHLKELDCLVQTYSFVGKVRTAADSPASEWHEEQVFAFGQKLRSHEKASAAAQSLAAFMGYTRNGISCYIDKMQIANFAPSLLTGVIHYPSFYHANIDFVNGLPVMKVELEDEVDKVELIDHFNGEYRARQIRIFKMRFDDKEGYAVLFEGLGDLVEPVVPKLPAHLLKPLSQCASMVVRFDDENCFNGDLTGGKASSLAVLSLLAVQSEKFKVARGVAVTTEAYAKFVMQKPVLDSIEKVRAALANRVETKELQKICEAAVSTIGDQAPPQEIRTDLEKQLQLVFGEIDTTKFAVRSSACGEDSEEMSAAGQMETFLGVKGFPAIVTAIAKCWASQFSFVAVQYRRRYGQLINRPMAVCVQEMVPSEVSGVMFTVDPVTADPRIITITANYGLGESVVNAAADPDTFVLEKTASGGRLLSMSIGSKGLRTVMLDDGGTQDITTAIGERTSTPCLSDDQINRLTKAAVAVEQHYACQRDTEWAFDRDGQLFMLQARPVTSAHSLDNEFEYYHEVDEGVVCEYDCLSKANVGEVFGGSVTPLTIDTTFGSFLHSFKAEDGKTHGLPLDETYFSRYEFFFRQNCQCFFATCTSRVDYSRDDVISKGFSIAMCGRTLNEEIIKKGAANKQRYARKPIRFSLLTLIKDMWSADATLHEAENYVRNAEYKLDKCKTSREMLISILSLSELQSRALSGHVKQIFYGTINNVFALTLLSHTEGGYTLRVYSDFAKMVASCNNLISADIPLALQRLSHQALEDYGSSFKELSVDDALAKLTVDKTNSADLFKHFLKTHGHRCLHEFDLATRPWEMDPAPVIKVIQSMIGTAEVTGKPNASIDELIQSLDIKLNLPKRLLLRFLLRKVRKGIANRERAKSNLILATHKFRLLFRQLADQMTREEILPDPELIFFLIPSEILQLIETRSPKIVIRAMNRRRVRDVAAKDIYPEHVSGLPIKPLNWPAPTDDIKGFRRMTGTPVSQGRIVATARVIISIDEAPQIQKGDILITYATDIGWSPYFPLLGGIVTELGGLISHGAVVAREFGLPCIVAAHGVTQMFRTGDKVLLDGTKGYIQSVD